jgi:hypothetical protein
VYVYQVEYIPWSHYSPLSTIKSPFSYGKPGWVNPGIVSRGPMIFVAGEGSSHSWGPAASGPWGLRRFWWRINLRSNWVFHHMGMDQYLLIPFLVGWTSINPSYFDVNRRGTRFWHNQHVGFIFTCTCEQVNTQHDVFLGRINVKLAQPCPATSVGAPGTGTENFKRLPIPRPREDEYPEPPALFWPRVPGWINT